MSGEQLLSKTAVLCEQTSIQYGKVALWLKKCYRNILSDRNQLLLSNIAKKLHGKSLSHITRTSLSEYYMVIIYI
jgi:hypothetical protein